MPDILYGKGAYRRDNGNFAELKLVNMFPEITPTVEAGVSVISRQGLRRSSTLGTGPIHDVYHRPGLFNGDLFTISGDQLFRNATLVGTVTGDQIPRWASSDREIVVTRGRTAYSYREGDFAAIDFPDGADVLSVTGMIGGLFVFLRRGTQRYYWSEVNDARAILGNSYAAAEIMPDDLRDLMSVADNLFLLGEESTEVHYRQTGNAAQPFARINQRTAPKGVIGTGAVVLFDNAMHFVGHDGIVYRMAEVPMRISDHSLEERIAKSAHFRLFTFYYQGHNFLCLRLDGGTWVFDPAGGKEWPEFRTHGLDNYIGQCATTPESGTIFGSAIDNRLFEFGDEWTDDTLPLERRFTGAFGIKGGSVPVDAIEVDCNPGVINPDDWPGIDPQLEMRASRDGGREWTMWRMARLGLRGQYRKRPRFRMLGYFDAPGALFDFRLIDPAPLRVSAVLVNEPVAGRQR